MEVNTEEIKSTESVEVKCKCGSKRKGKRIGVGTKVVLRRKFNCENRKSGYGSTGGGVAAIEDEVQVWELQF